MQDKRFDTLVFIGRFQPFHQGHQFVVNLALAQARQVILLIGSANAPRTPKNPFSVAERQAMILGSFDESERSRIRCLGLDDATYNDNRWLMGVTRAIDALTDHQGRIGIIGHAKDESSYYLSLFPQYDSFWVENFQGLSATPIREAYFGDDPTAWQAAHAHLTPAGQALLDEFKTSEDFARLKREFDHIWTYQQAWQAAPYPPSFITADALVVQSGHILLIERGGDYGQGLYALPGGFVDQGEDFLSAAIRELGEETGLGLSKDALLPHLKAAQLFDAPKRSQRARTVSMAYYFELPACEQLPALQGGDDARRAFWLPLAKLDASQMFEDHYGIITKLLGI